MPEFSYKAINERGENVSGSIEADSAEMASNMLNSQGFIPSSVKKAGDVFGVGVPIVLKDMSLRVKTSDLLLFTKQFRTMLKVGIPIIKILQVMERNTENQKLQKIISQMVREISEGKRLCETFSKYPKVFNGLYCSMVQAGESSDSLFEVFDRLVKIIEHEHKVKTDIKIALQYPIFVTIALVVAFFLLLTKVIPKYLHIFESHNIPLPLATRISKMIHEFILNYGDISLLIIVISIISLMFYFRTEQGKLARDAFLLKIPLIGTVLTKANISRFANIFEILQTSGVHVMDSMKILSGTLGNAAISKDFETIKSKIEQGGRISGPFAASKHFTPMATSMIAIGEESDSLNDMLSEISTHYDDEVEYSVKRLTEAIAPLLTIGLACIIGFFALSIFVPMADISKILK